MATYTPQTIAESLYRAVAQTTDTAATEKIIKRVATQIRAQHLTHQLDEIIDHFVHIYNQEHAILPVTITSRYPLSDNTLADIRTFLARTYLEYTFEIETVVSEELIGGIRITTADTEFDYSLAHGLTQLEHTLSQ